MQTQPSLAERAIATADQMRRIEERLFAAGMPVAALMEKVAGLIARRIQELYPQSAYGTVGVLVGPGHNGGDALVVARELHWAGYGVTVYAPIERLKDLTAAHASYGESLGLTFVDSPEALQYSDLILDGLFGFGLERPIEGDLAAAIAQINRWNQPVVSIDLPSGIHTDTGEVLGTAVQASRTFCLGLWKRAFFQDGALAWMGQAERLDFQIPEADIQAILGPDPQVSRLTPALAWAGLPLPRRPDAHKYRAGSLLLIAGSQTYAGASLLTGLGARSSGVGMLTLLVPTPLKPMLNSQIPEALVIGADTTDTGAIAALPDSLDLSRYDAVACGPGLSQGADAVLEPLMASDRPLVLDADGLNRLAVRSPIDFLQLRSAPTLLTPHPGEFKRLFPEIWEAAADPGAAAQEAAAQTGAVVVLKGARTAIADPDRRLWYLPDSTPALARGGSGDVLTGLLGGLLTQQAVRPEPAIADSALATALAGVWWHAQAGQRAAAERTDLGVDPTTLADYLLPTLQAYLAAEVEP